MTRVKEFEVRTVHDGGERGSIAATGCGPAKVGWSLPRASTKCAEMNKQAKEQDLAVSYEVTER